MKRKFKILTILMCVAVLLVGSVVSVSAATLPDDAPACPESSFTYYFVAELSDGNVNHYYSDFPFCVIEGIICCDDSSSGYYFYSETNLTWNKNITNVALTSAGMARLITLTANHNICDESGAVVFQKALTSVIVPAVKTLELEKVIQEVILMIPIGLACWVGYVALRKGLAILRQILYPA